MTAARVAPPFRLLRPVEVRTVLDCPDLAWDHHEPNGLGDFGLLYSDLICDAGRELVRQHLIHAWRQRGFQRIRFVSYSEMRAQPDGDVPDEDAVLAVHEWAAGQIDDDALLCAAGLTDEYAAWRGTQDDRDY